MDIQSQDVKMRKQMVSITQDTMKHNEKDKKNGKIKSVCLWAKNK